MFDQIMICTVELLVQPVIVITLHVGLRVYPVKLEAGQTKFSKSYYDQNQGGPKTLYTRKCHGDLACEALCRSSNSKRSHGISETQQTGCRSLSTLYINKMCLQMTNALGHY